jgi:hypothetical protein
MDWIPIVSLTPSAKGAGREFHLSIFMEVLNPFDLTKSALWNPWPDYYFG